MDEVKITIVGAGVVGLAVAYELSKYYQDIYVLEKNSSFGQETSSRNSEVIHAGIYYPKDSLKVKTCIEGRGMLYEFCQKNKINHKKIGKLIVALDQSEVKDLEELYKNGRDNGVEDLILLSGEEVKKMEPQVRCVAAIHSPSTGILDSHALMQKLLDGFQASSGQVAYLSELTGIARQAEGFKVKAGGRQGGDFEFFTRVLINCAGLNSDKVAAQAGIDRPDYKLKYCKGDYFRVSGAKSKLVKRLVYPVPKKDRAGLGIHATPDLAGSLRLGPDDEYVSQPDYQVNPEKKEIFCRSVRPFLPFIEESDLSPDTSGIRPKLQGPNEGFRDFLVKDEKENGLPGLINLIGIESPGLTACLALAKLTGELISGYL